MKQFLALSLTLNVVLLGAVGTLVVGQQQADRNQPHSGSVEVPEIMKAQSPLKSPAFAEPFRWSHLEADDYTRYISNLRGIGCPEATIRRLVSSEVHDTYAEKRRELEARMSSQAAPKVLAAEIQKLAQEETALLTSVLQPTVAAPQQKADEGFVPAGSDFILTYSDFTTRIPRVQTVSMPLVFQIADQEPAPATASNASNPTPNANTTPLNDAQRQAVEVSRKEFVDAIGGNKQDTNDPEYLRRWQKAQWVAEEKLRAQLGDELYNQMQIQAAQREYQAAGAQ